jgi:septation ring formation regulator EzrA
LCSLWVRTFASVNANASQICELEATMQDSLTPIDTSFERWTKRSDAFEQHLSHMKQGDEKARAEALRLARELDALTRLISRDLNSVR